MRMLVNQRAGTLFGLVLLTMVWTGCQEPMQMTILYQEAQGLKTGDPVVYQEHRIGEVTAIETHERGRRGTATYYVTVNIEEDYQEALYHQMDFVLRGRELFSDEKGIYVSDAPVTRKRIIEQGDLVIGKGGAEAMLGSIGKVLDDVFRELENEWPRIQREIDRELQAVFRELEREMPELLEELERELPEVLEEVEHALRTELNNVEFDDLIRELEEATEEASTELARELERIAAELKHKRY